MKLKPIGKKENIVVQELENELLVYDLKTNKAFCLNETSAFVFQLCDGKNSVAEISDLMSQKLKTLVSEDFVLLALNELKKDRLLENTAEMKEFFEVFPRREIIKRVGLASMIALPFIISVTAPSAVNAQSCISAGFNCTLNQLTQSDCCADLRCEATRLTPLQGMCVNCVDSGLQFVPCSLVGGCGNCNTFPFGFKNRCCNSSATATNDGTNCLCG